MLDGLCVVGGPGRAPGLPSPWGLGLGPAAVGHGLGDVAPLLQLLGVLLGAHPVALSGGDDLRRQVVVVDGDLSGVGDRVEDELGADGPFDVPLLGLVVGLLALT